MTKSDPILDPGADALVEAAKNGYAFRKRDEGWVLEGDEAHLILRIEPQSMASPEVTELVSLLNLVPGRTQYDLVAARRSQGGERDAEGRFTEIALDTRSLLGTMFYLAQAVDVPEKHREANLVTTTLTADGQPFDWQILVGDLLRIQHCRMRPKNAAVTIPYRGHWFYIADDDLNSKSTFALIGQLFSLQAGTAASGGPALTLPVGG